MGFGTSFISGLASTGAGLITGGISRALGLSWSPKKAMKEQWKYNKDIMALYEVKLGNDIICWEYGYYNITKPTKPYYPPKDWDGRLEIYEMGFNNAAFGKSCWTHRNWNNNTEIEKIEAYKR